MAGSPASTTTPPFLKSLRDDEMLKDLERQRLESELQYLKYQLNPHFFMNTLNNIYALVDLNTEQAKKTIIELSKLMRYVLYEANKNQISLEHEIQFLENYIALMKLRYIDNLNIRTEFPVVVPCVQIPPLLFISLLENAFKHGVSYQDLPLLKYASNWQTRVSSLIARTANIHMPTKMPIMESV